VPPERIRGRFFGRKGRVVYRLGALGPGGLALVAKRCKRARAEVEERLYVRWLPALGVSAPRCLGTCVEGEWAWIFLEDVGTTRLDKELPAERALALRWLAELHARGRRLAPGGLPARGVASFHDSLEAARTALGAALARDGCPCDERRLLAGVLDACARANSQWGRLEALCAAMPATLVHGDFSRKNLYVRLAGGEATLLPIDWEYAGWGVPAVDLGCFLRQRATSEDLAAYRRALARHGLHVEETELRRWVTAGRFLRALVSIQWASTSLAFARREKALANLGAYRQALEEAGAELGGGAP
jgi:aminoglycoside phosphotransferase (APT) family kinase protein